VSLTPYMQILFVILKIIGWIALVILGWLVVVHPVTKLVRRRTGLPDPTFIIYFINNPIRRKFQPPGGVVDHVHIQEGMNILEVGPGTGFYTFEAARRAGPSGHVYAIDIKPRVIAILNGRVEQAAVKNITTKVASAYEIPLPSESIDRVFMVHVLPEIPDKQKALHEIRRVLKRGGLLTLAEGLIDPDYRLQKTEISWCRDTGFELVGSYGTVLFYVLTFQLA
jgi:SAM-dependent methyltransferase